MSQSARTLVAAIAGAALVALLVVTFRPVPVAAAPVASPGTSEQTHTISVTSTGKVTLVPDVARVGFGITVQRPTVEAARADAARVMTAVIAAVHAKGVAEKDVQTTAIDLSPQYEACSYGCAGPGKIVGYVMSEQVQVTVRSLDATGSVIDGATAAGATNVNGVSFQVADPDAAQDQARAQAVTSARAKADAMAKVAGVSVTGVISISEASVTSPIPYMAMPAAGASDSAKTPVSPGTTDVEATVTMVFEID
ncbi:MAG TPA: SIMPL domain-containing protein [Candidatus Dormibacteraeota bacterium]|nr:SIMPL domain-containing protein [Candidatus Dormibacteraeota bacterium]